MRTIALSSARGAKSQPRLWLYLCLAQLCLLLLGSYWYYQKSQQIKQLARPLIIQTNLMVTNILTNIELQTNIVVRNEVVTNIVQTNLPVRAAAPPARSNPAFTGPKVQVRGYNIVPINGIKYAHAIVQNITTNTLRHTQIRFNEYSLNRRGRYLVGNVTDSTANLGPFQFWEMIKPIDGRTLQIELAGLTASE